MTSLQGQRYEYLEQETIDTEYGVDGMVKDRREKGRVLPAFEGDIIDLGERKLEVIHVPGHTPGSITLLDREERCLIGGDPVQIDGEIYMFGLHRDMEAYVLAWSI